MTQEQQDEKFGLAIISAIQLSCNVTDGEFHVPKATIGRVVRELLADGKLVEARPDVPSVEELRKSMWGDGTVKCSGLLVEATTTEIIAHCAHVAHDMMLQLAPRRRMMIDGLSIADLANIIETMERDPRGSVYSPNRARAAEEIHRLANTPAEDAPDPDAVAKDLCWQYRQASGMKRHLTRDDAWDHQSLESRRGWRAVAAKMGGREGMSKHTPGPWQAIGTDPAEGGDWFWIKAQPHSALRGFSKEIGVVNGGQNDPEQQANARLIAAAPDLLKALTEIVSQIDQGDSSGKVFSRDHCITSARAAIAQATGENAQ